MVDAVVSVVVQRLGDLLIEQFVFLRDVREDVEWLKNKLEWMQCFLRDAEEKQDGDARIRMWILDIRDVAYDAEDIIDDFILKVKEEDGGGTPRRLGLKASSFKKFFCICSNQESYIHKQAILYGIGKGIEALKKRLDEIHRNQEIFKIVDIGGEAGGRSSQVKERLKQLRRESPYEDNEHVVGLEKDADFLISKLVKEDPHRSVISIVGMGGLGKTTLARKIYSSSSLDGKFDCRGWVSVSKDYNVQDLLQKIIASFQIPITEEQWKMMNSEQWNMMNSEESLEQYLRMYLNERSYFVVIDDVWDTDAWAILRRAFPDKKNGSRVIITTRNNTVAERSDARTYVHRLQFLRDEESWELFCRKAFANHGETNSCPPTLEAIARDMVSKCQGLPLAVTVLGGLLSKKHPDEWTKVQEHLWMHVKGGTVPVSHILALSINNLPRHLRLCFLYLGLFPEDFEFEVEKLLQLWVAEGFIQPSEESLEEIAAKYLEELIDRNLIQIAERTWRRIQRCRVHDLLRDLALEKSKELNFCSIFDGNKNLVLSPGGSRRLASHHGFERFVSCNHSNTRLRTFLFFNKESEMVRRTQLEFVCTKLRLLRVLHLDGTDFGTFRWEGTRLPDETGKLIHLRYLGIRGSRMQELPPFIGHLGALQTLDFGDECMLLTLPKEICNAKQLRHLIGKFRWSSEVNNLTNLRTLKGIYVEDRMDFDPEGLSNLCELYVEAEGEGFSLDSIGGLRSLQAFSLSWLGEPECFPTLQPLSHCHRLLQLKLHGRIGKLPSDLHDFLPNLKYLCLDAGRKKEDPFPILEKLQSLVILHLEQYSGNKLSCSAGGFPRLEILLLVSCYCLEELSVDGGGMPMLQGLVYNRGKVSAPERFRSLPTPKNCDLSGDEWPY